MSAAVIIIKKHARQIHVIKAAANGWETAAKQYSELSTIGIYHKSRLIQLSCVVLSARHVMMQQSEAAEVP